MKNQNNIIVSAAFLIVLILAYYFLFFLPQQKTKELRFAEMQNNIEWQLKCEEYGKNKYGDTYESHSDGTIIRDYYFSPKLNSCVMILRIHLRKEGSKTFELIDMFSETGLPASCTNAGCYNMVGNLLVDEYERCSKCLNDFIERVKEVTGIENFIL